MGLSGNMVQDLEEAAACSGGRGFPTPELRGCDLKAVTSRGWGGEAQGL